jgi:polysaccharide transporter, PST family
VNSNQPVESSKRPWDAFARGVRDNLIAEVGSQGIRVAGIVILARMLMPGDFGVYRILLVVSMFVTLFSEAGIPDALIQRKKLQSSHEATGWWLTVALTGTCVAGLYVLAPLLERLMEMPGLGFGLRLICIPSMLEGASIIANTRLKRQIRFGPLAMSEVVAECVFAVVAILLVWLGYPRWSLPGGLAARLCAHAIFILAAEPYVPREMPRASAARDFGRFATVAFGGRLLTVTAGNIDYVLVGRLLGSTALGFYSTAWDLLRFVPARLYRIAGRVALPAFAKVQDDNEELARAYRNLLDYIARFVLPVSGCVAIAAPELLSSVYGTTWLPAATPMRILTLGLGLAGIRIGIGTVFYAKNYPSLDIYLMSGRLALLVAIILLTAQQGLSAVSVGVSAVEAIASIAGQYMVCSLIGFRLRDLISAIVPGSRLALACMLATAAGKVAGIWLGVKAPLVLLLVAIPPAAIFSWLQAGDAAQMIGAAFKRTPDKVVQAS